MIDEFARALAGNLKFHWGKSWTRASVADNRDSRACSAHAFPVQSSSTAAGIIHGRN
jgi:hypothetical protein